MKFISRVAFAVAMLFSTDADAGKVLDVSYIDTFENADNSAEPNVNIRQYSNIVPYGGGEFVIGVGDAATNCTSDHGVVLRDKHGSGNCYYRQFSGPVHLSWYGVADAGDPACYNNAFSGCDARPVLHDALTASATYGDGGVVTDGRSIAIIDANITIPSNQYLSCNGPPGGARDQGDDLGTNYYKLRHSIVLNPARKIIRNEQSRLSDCILRPSWYVPTTTTDLTIPPTTVLQTVQMMHQFTGTATTCDGEACNMDNMLIIGFDTCDETTKQRSILSNLLEECNVNEWIHDNGGGMKLQNVIVKQYIEGSLPTGLDHVSWPITFVQQEIIAGSGTGRIVIRIDIGSGPDNLVHAGGDTVLIDGLGLRHSVITTGKLGSGSDMITDIPGGDASGIIIGDAISDSGASSGCIPTGTVVNDVEIVPGATGTVTASNPMNSGCDGSYGLKFTGTSVAPVGGNGRWLTDGVTNYSGSLYDVTLVGASWAGPSDSSASWKIGIPVITVLDTTNIIPGQYICGSGSPPFCNVPTDFAFAGTTLQTTMTATTPSTVTVAGTSSPPLLNWPLNGTAKIVTGGATEIVGYTVSDGTHLSITARHLRGTTAIPHSVNDPITGAAPVVLGVVPTSEAVIVSVPAQNNGSGTVVFTNDTYVISGTGIVLGQLTLNPGYHTWTSNPAAGPNPSGVLTVLSSSDPTHQKVTPSKNVWKVQSGMAVADLTTPGNIKNGSQNGGTVASVNSDGTVTLDSADTILSFSSDKLQFTGCGFPSGYPWLGNCASTSLLAGGGNDLAQGVVCEYFHSFGNQIQFHTIDAPATSCTNSVLAGGGGLGDQIDPDSVALWLDGDATKTQFTNGRIAGATTSILDTPDKNGNGGGQADGVGLSNIQIPGNIILGPDSNAVITGLHGHPAGSLSNPFIYAASAMLSTQISGSYLPQWPIYFDDTGVLPKMFCSGNDFATPLCGQTKTTPSCTSGCVHSTDVSGNDGDFDVTTNGTATSITVTLAVNYPAKPICRASTSTTSSGTAASAVISLVTLQSFGTTVTFKTSPAVPHIYGSCHSPTG